ncbi:MAG: hypothetical protein CMM45_02255 [Rhodospirillaceae bacterium]|nr:hypothetical protein [Rhodospirillaceae bacterium]
MLPAKMTPAHKTISRDPKPRPFGNFFFFVLVLVTIIGPLSLHLFFPSTPSVKAEFNVSESVAQLSVSAPMFVMAFMTLIFGYLADRLGRRRVLIGGILLFSIGGAISIAAETIWFLIFGRLVQAAGGACGITLARIIARDKYGQDQLVRAIAYLTMGYSLGPIFAPPIGGYLVEMFGWRSVLILALVAGLKIVTLVYFFIDETKPTKALKSDQDNEARSILKDFILLFRDIKFTSLTFQIGLSTGAFFTLATGAAFIMMENLGRPATEYGLYFTLLPCGYLLGNFVSGRVGSRVSIETMVLVSTAIMVAAISSFATFTFAGILSPMTLFGFGSALTFGQGMSTAYAQSGLLRVPSNLTGTAGGIGAFAQMFGAAVLSQLYGFLADGTVNTLVIIVGAATILALIAATINFFFNHPIFQRSRTIT